MQISPARGRRRLRCEASCHFLLLPHAAKPMRGTTRFSLTHEPRKTTSRGRSSSPPQGQVDKDFTSRKGIHTTNHPCHGHAYGSSKLTFTSAGFPASTLTGISFVPN